MADNLLNRDFGAAAPNQVWLADITHVRTCEGWLCLAAVLDVYSRKITDLTRTPRHFGYVSSTSISYSR